MWWDPSAPTPSWYGDYVLPTPGFGAELGATNYIPNGGDTLDAPVANAGAFNASCVGPFTKNSKTKLVGITDGTSNTLCIGETVAGVTTGSRDYKLSWMGSASMWANYGIPSDTAAAWYTYSSKHTGVVQFSMCDGSVRGFTKGINYPTAAWTAFQELSGMMDGQVIDYSQFP